jgi:ribonuclease J
MTMARVTFYGGVDEIGGNKILVETEDGSVLLDFGRRMGYTHDFYSQFLQIRSKNALRDMIRLNILPKIDGIYTPNLLNATLLFTEEPRDEQFPFDKAPDYWTFNGVMPYTEEKHAVDAVFVSHAHFDHIQDVSFLDPRIPVICTDKTKTLARAMTDVSPSGVDDQYYEVNRNLVIKETGQDQKNQYKTLCLNEYECSEITQAEKPVIEDPKTKFLFTHEYTPQYREFKTDLEDNVKGIKYKLIPVGHSVSGACSVLLTLPNGKRVLYTGDIRFHGLGETTFDDYVKAIGQPVDVLITEGTRIEKENIITEQEIFDEMTKDIAKAEGLVLINFGWKDLTRFSTVYQASLKNDRTLLIGYKLAYLLYEMHVAFPKEYPDPRTMPNLKVYLQREGDLLYSKADYAKDKSKMGYLSFHGRNMAKADRNIVRIAEVLGLGGEVGNKNNPLLTEKTTCDYKEVYDLATHHLSNGVRAYQIRDRPKNFVVMFSFWDLNELFDLVPMDSEHNTRYICASTEPFCEEMEIDEDKFMNWFDYFGVHYDWEYADEEKEQKIFTRRHVSGHACQKELVELIRAIKPSRIIPIHTTSVATFKKIFGDAVTEPKYGVPIDIS